MEEALHELDFTAFKLARDPRFPELSLMETLL